MILAVIGFALVFFGTLFVLALCRMGAMADRRVDPYGRPLFFCERCERRTAMRITSSTATVLACSDHDLCGFRRCLRDERHPENFGILYDPAADITPGERK